MCGRVGRDDECLVTRLGEFRRRRRGDRALSDAALASEEEVLRLFARHELVDDRVGVCHRIEVDRAVGVHVSRRADINGRFCAVVQDATDIREQIEASDLAGLKRVRRRRVGVKLLADPLDDGLFVRTFPLEEGVFTH